MMETLNVDHGELEKFGQLAHRWWDPTSEFRPLHVLNPLRVAWIDELAGLDGTKALDVGCGGGLLTEGMARLGAQVTGIDLSERPLGVARLHLHESGLQVDYQLVAAEAFAGQRPGQFAVVSCMEMLEHVPDPASTVQACATLCAPGGHVFFSTLNRTPKAYALAVVGAEYVLRLLPKGTHDYERFIRPAELTRWCRDVGLQVEQVVGVRYNPFSHQASICADTDINYMLHARKPAA